jgi:hypothetical protein
VIHGKIKSIRDRSASTKRKGASNEELPSKSARLEPAECPHLKVIDQNKDIFKKVLDNLSEYKGADSILCAAIMELSIGMNGMNDILGVLMAERLIPGNSPDPIVPVVNVEEECLGASSLPPPPPSRFNFNQSNPGNNPRRTLQQAPLGDQDTWAKAVGRKQQRQDNSSRLQARDQSVDQSNKAPKDNGKTSQENSFNKAVKDAERSILIFNLNLGSTPVMNPATMSSKVTHSLMELMKVKENSLFASQEAKDFIDDILSQVVKMDFFGSKTVPCKNQGNSVIQNASYYTIPVKMVFKDRRSAQTASELLRECVGINTSTPYHKSLRAAITMAVKMTKDANPGYQGKANLDLNGRTLKCFIRKDSNPPGSWAPYGKNIPLPSEALDPHCKDYSSMSMQEPTRLSPRDSRTKTRATDTRVSGNQSLNNSQERMDTESATQSTAATGDKSPIRSIEEMQKQLSEINKVSSPLPDFMLTPKDKGKVGKPNLKKSTALVMHSPPPAEKTPMGSLGS